MTILSTDSIDLLAGSTGDLVVVGGRFQMSNNLAGVVQGVRRRILAIAGEWFLDLDFGVRWFERVGVPADQAIFGQKFDQIKADAEIRKAILATPAVTSIVKLDVSFAGATRACSIAWQARCTFGDTPVDVIAVGA